MEKVFRRHSTQMSTYDKTEEMFKDKMHDKLMQPTFVYEHTRVQMYTTLI